jgi:phage minor structural protein
MIPVLYEQNETQFLNNGIGRLTDAISCEVEENLNGLYELTMTYPIAGQHYSDITENRIILAEPFEGGNWQPFIIYRISRPLNGIVTVNAEHISYLLNKIIVMPYTAGSCAQALSFLPSYTANDCPFTFWTDKSVTGTFKVDYPRPARGLLGGEDGSILDVYGKGEYAFDRFNVRLYVNRGADRGVTIRYGKNLTELVRDSDISNVYTGIVPYWKKEDELVTLPEEIVWSDYRSQFANDIVKAVDMSSNWQEAPTVEQLRTAAVQYVTRNEGWKINENIKISFVALWQTEEYKNIAAVERVRLGDTVHVIYDALNVSVSAEVIKTVYDSLTERYVSVELGAKQNTLGTVLKDAIAPGIVSETTSYMDEALKYATDLITGGLGGHVVISTNADGQPNEILIMDTEDKETAQQVLRINMNGIGFSSNGVDGPFDTAWTLDGHFVANYIDSGVLNANVMRAGIIRDLAGANWWNLDTGEMHLNAEAVVDTSNFVTQAQFTAAADRIATEVVEQVGSGIFFNVVPTDNGQTVTLRAHVYLNRNDATRTFPEQFFKWYKKTESSKEYIGYGYEITVVKSEYGYGGEVEAEFLMLEDRYPVNSQGRWVFTEFGSYHQLTVSQGSLLYRQGYPVVWSASQDAGNVYPVFGYDYETSGA